MADTLLQDLEARLALRGLAQRLGAALARSAAPALAPRWVAEVLEAAAGTGLPQLAQAWAQRPDELGRVLSAVCGAAPFFVPHLVRHPQWLLSLLDDDLTSERSAAAYAERLTTAMTGIPLTEHADALRRFKYCELARITVRELSADLVPPERSGEVLAELSHLADALLARALASAAAEMASSCGPPCWRGSAGEEITLRFCVLGLGKLGGEELNYSSDVDLIYIFESPPGGSEGGLSGGPRGLSPAEYFARLAREFGRLVSEPTAEGFLYRIDLELRPDGNQGALVISAEALANYYELWAATWEKAAMMKARPVAGDIALGWRAIRAVSPMIYRSAMDLAGVNAIKAMQEKIERSRLQLSSGAAAAPGSDALDVKFGHGGIRDVEFIVQALQLLHGGRIPEVRGRSTQGALLSLTQVGVLPEAEATNLLAGYRFLRRTENCIQMEAERQTHRLPSEHGDRERLARAMGFVEGDAVAAFERELTAHRQRIREVFTTLFHEQGGDQTLALFARGAGQLLGNPATRPLIDDLAGRFAHEIEVSVDPERAMNNLDRFIRGVGQRRFYYELLIDRPELVPRLTALFAASEFLSRYFATHPRLIEPIFSDPNVLLLSRQELRDALISIRDDLAREGTRDVAELELDALRLFHARELVNVGLLDLGGKVSLAAVKHALTEIAEVCIDFALRFAQAEIERRAGGVAEAARAGEFLVVGMGKLASWEIVYGSDLDVIFLYDVGGADEHALLQAQEYFVRLAQKLIWALQTRTTEGVCYEIDARLRPSGQQGMLVTSLASLERYHAGSAQVWERQALLRARPLAGGERLGRTFEALRRTILQRPLPDNAGHEIHRIRVRTESELAHESRSRHDFKTGRGGLHDVESVVQFLQLQHGAAHPELFTVDSVAAHLTRLERLGLVDSTDARVLREGWEFLELLSSRLRIVENRSISDLDEERGDLDTLARRLGYPASERGGGARRALLDAYRRHTGAIRAVYLKVLGVG